MSKSSKERFDFNFYLLGDLKQEFIFFLSESYKQNFIETLSWGNFKRYQLILKDDSNWLNIIFNVFKQDSDVSVLLNNFKVFEKRNPVIILFNPSDKTSSSSCESIFNNIISEKNKFYGSIDSEVSEHLKMIYKEDKPTEYLKKTSHNLKFVNSDQQDLVIKLGFIPNMSVKKIKSTKKGDSSFYSLTTNTFELAGSKVNFIEVMQHLVAQQLNLLMMNRDPEEILNQRMLTEPQDLKQTAVVTTRETSMRLKILYWSCLVAIFAMYYGMFIN